MIEKNILPCKFHLGQLIIIIDGFYKGQKGKIIDVMTESRNNNLYIIYEIDIGQETLMMPEQNIKAHKRFILW